MNRISMFLLSAAAGSLLAATPALADRDADGPIDAPRQIDSLHTEFTLPGGPWRQTVGALSGTPVFGSFGYVAKLPSGGDCTIYVSVRADAKRLHPVVGRRTVRLTPPGSELLRFDQSGRHDGVRWWSGRVLGSSNLAAAGAVQRMPAPLRNDRRRWLVHRIDANFAAAPQDEAACRSRMRRTAARTVRSVARTLSVADGPPIAEPPFQPA